jgi:hypothetical protein
MERTMRRFLLMLMLFLAVTLLPMPTTKQVQAQDPWSMWIHEANGSRRLWLINSDGAVLNDLSLPIPDMTYNVLSQYVSTSRNGRYIAYMVQHNVNLDYRFQVYDVIERTMFSGLYTPPFVPDGYVQHGLDFGPGSTLWDETDTRLAIAYNAGTGWELNIVDMGARRTTHTLRSSDPMVTATGLDPSPFVGIPWVQDFSQGEVSFTYMNSLEGGPRFRSFVWNIDTNLFFETTVYPQPTGDTLFANGDVIVSYQDETYPNYLDRIIGIPIQFNVVQVTSLDAGQFIWYTNEFESIGSLDFVQGGERVLMRTYDHRTDTSRWQLRERSGLLVSDIDPFYRYNSLHGTLDGFVWMTTDLLAEGFTVLKVDTTSGDLGSSTSIWTAPAGTTPYIVSVHDDRLRFPAGLGPWGMLAMDGGVPPTAEPPGGSGRPLAAGDIVVGGIARVFTTDGDPLNVRSAPGVGYGIVDRLMIEDRVTVLEGPANADGFTWWRIRTPSGVEGWAVDFADGIPTLIPE